MTRDEIIEAVKVMFDEETSERQRAKIGAKLVAEHLTAQNRIADALERLASKVDP